METTSRVTALVESWAKAQGWDVDHVLSAKGQGSDWAGSTEGGFYETFGVDVEFIATGGERRVVSVEGTEMAALWNHIVGAVD